MLENLNAINMANISTKRDATLWRYLYRYSKLGPRSIWRKQNDYKLEEFTQTICDKMIRYRMSKLRLDHSMFKSPKVQYTPSPDLMNSIHKVFDLLIGSFPELYTDVAVKISLSTQDERGACKVFCEFAESLFTKGISWPLIISLLAFSGSLAVDCMQSGRSILVHHIRDWATVFLVLRTKDWLKENGGWDGVVNFTKDKEENQCKELKANSHYATIQNFILYDKQLSLVLLVSTLLLFFLLIYSLVE